MWHLHLDRMSPGCLPGEVLLARPEELEKVSGEREVCVPDKMDGWMD